MSRTTKHIALVCPGGPITQDLAQNIARIAATGFGEDIQLHFHPQCFFNHGHFSGTDEERSAAFLEVANDPKFDAVWFARGGYGACRLDDALFTKLNNHARQKTYLGYSDTGILLARLYAGGVGHPVHGPMPTDCTRENGHQAIERALDFLATGARVSLEPSLTSSQTGDKKTVAFNLTVLSHMLSAEWMPDLSNHIIMLEDVGEYLYRIDRAMFTVTSSPKLRKAAGIQLGRISDIPENDRPFGQTEEEITQYWCQRARLSYLGRADIGHDVDNKIVPFGACALP